ncbi:MAG: biopolymer transporter ExbD [candidate division KSB1 bacterium]|nr:biopolymer transporter ExbD [candidate division KSB1 bacterium]MDZ7335664.1 biopolymer transporter ExbD [candidate division KSB1 bacterium]MDZ7357717.1 biopolymer transporter ExbD [candidate division KSB1 bacterium]MDZ7375223.1 biopolymer transporter ExbD [candidate division KSB1 bacterium]MDZ7402041.1 biopolymer transporter ExbD [candidate division KSB1 bacterium]
MAFIPSRRKKHDTNPGKIRVNLTSMMDMFTIILVFLLKNYSTEGLLIQPSEYLTLPTSTIERSPEVALDLVISKEWVMLNHEPIEKVANIMASDGLLIEPLQQKLLMYAREAKKMEVAYGTKFSGKVTIQGDKEIPYRLLVKVMATCGRSEYPNMRLVVYRKEA